MSRTEVPLNSDLISVDVWRDVLTLLDLIKETLSFLVLLSLPLLLSIKKFPGTLAMKCPVLASVLVSFYHKKKKVGDILT